MNIFKQLNLVNFLWLMSFSAFAASPVSLTNGGFESGLTGWSTTGGVTVGNNISVMDFVDGTESHVINANETSMAQLDNELSNPVVPVADLNIFFGLDSGTIESYLPIGQSAYTDGSAIKQELTVDQTDLDNGNSIQQYYNLFLRDDLSFGDRAYAVLKHGSALIVMQDLNPGSIPPNMTARFSGWQNFSHTPTATGGYTLGFIVLNAFDEYISPALFLDNGAGINPNVPEPPVLILFVFALCALLSFHHRRRVL